MIFNQLFDEKSHTYTYIISSGKGREALIIDPVIEKTNEYLKVLKNLELKLVKVIDTHIHADHVTGLNELNKQTNCTRVMGETSPSEVIDIKVKDNEKIKIETQYIIGELMGKFITSVRFKVKEGCEEEYIELNKSFDNPEGQKISRLFKFITCIHRTDSTNS